MKKIALFLTLLLLSACGFSGCGKATSKKAKTTSKTSEKESPSSEEISQTPVEREPVGGFTVVSSAAGSIPEYAKVAFHKAFEGLVGVSYTPLALIGERYASGRDYAFLAKSRVVYPSAKPKLCVVFVRTSSSGETELTGISDFVLTDYLHKGMCDLLSALFSDGWSAPNDGEMTSMPQDLASAWSCAAMKLENAELYPMALLGTQVVAGVNYAVVCRGKSAAEQEKEGVYIATLYRNLSNDATVISLCPLDAGAFGKKGE